MNKLKRVHSKTTDKQSPAKRQYRNESEKRRRDLFTQLIRDLKDILFIENTSTTNEDYSKLDKASVLRQAAHYLKENHQNLTTEVKLALGTLKSGSSLTNNRINFNWKPSCDIVNSPEWFQIAIESMNCFYLVIQSNSYLSEIKYISTNIQSLFDYSQDELINQLLFQFILPSDYEQLLLYLSNDHQILDTCDVSWKRSLHQNDYEQCRIIGAYRTINQNERYLMSIVQINTLDRPFIVDIHPPIKPFLSHLNPQGRFTFIDSRAREYLGYNSSELIGRTYFDFVHPDDLPILVRAYRLWKEKSNEKSETYRFLTKGQQWISLQTSSQSHKNSWSGRIESFICTTFIVHGSSSQQRSTTIETTSKYSRLINKLNEVLPVKLQQRSS